VIIGSSCPNPTFSDGVSEQDVLKEKVKQQQFNPEEVSVKKVRELFT
jgi:hypothetical protein